MTRSRKSGVEDIILMRLPAGRFLNHIPLHYLPPLDNRSRYQVAMVIQSCTHNAYGSHETGPSHEFHFWLRTSPFVPGKTEQADSIKLPVQSWYSLASASENPWARDYLQSFGFRPHILEKVSIQEKGGTVIFRDHGRIDWSINGRGRGLKRVGIDHILNVETDKPDSDGHHIHATISDPVMDQTGRINILTDVCEPFLHRGERFAAVVHRMSRLEADIEWRKKINTTFTY